MWKRTSAWVVVTPMTNEELVERVPGGDADSIEKLLQNNQEYLYKLARRLSNILMRLKTWCRRVLLQFWMLLALMSRHAAHCF